jgi:hypothetical protein
VREPAPPPRLYPAAIANNPLNVSHTTQLLRPTVMTDTVGVALRARSCQRSACGRGIDSSAPIGAWVHAARRDGDSQGSRTAMMRESPDRKQLRAYYPVLASDASGGLAA